MKPVRMPRLGLTGQGLQSLQISQAPRCPLLQQRPLRWSICLPHHKPDIHVSLTI